MVWSFPLGELAGTRFRVHALFGVLAALAAYRFSEFGARGALFGVLAVLLFLASVVLHELAHVVVARRIGLRVRGVVLLPLGGSLDASAASTRVSEFLVAVAGPTTSLAAAASLFAATRVAFPSIPPPTPETLQPDAPTLVAVLISANILLGILNLLPVFPMDGGRATRALLSIPLGRWRATQLITLLGQGLAVALGVLAIVTARPVLALVGVMLFLAAGRERSEARVRGNLSRLTAGELWERGTELEPGTPLAQLAGSLVRSSQRAFPVFLGERLLGVVVKAEALAGLERLDDHPYVASVMRRTVPAVAATMAADAVLEMMHALGTPVVAVEADTGELLGFITEERMAEAAHGR